MSQTHRPSGSDEPLFTRIKGEYGEMPGLSLTASQARRLWALDPDTTARILTRLMEARFLRRTAVGKYVRAGADLTARP